MKLKLPFLFFVVVFCGALAARAADSETMAGRALRQLIEQQKALFAEAAKKQNQPDFDQEAFRSQLQEVSHGYERLLQENPKFAEAYAAYGYLLGKIEMRKESVAMLLKANELNPDLPLVKNQLGNYLAEDGKPLEAVNYFLAAIKLAPAEPLYHYQLGTLLSEARDDFLKSGEWTRPAIERAMHNAFRHAAELAPERVEFVYRYAESFYDLEQPDWDAALKVWGKLEEKAPTAIERETMRLHAANVLIKQGKPDHASALLETVTEPSLQTQKQKLVAQLEESGKK